MILRGVIAGMMAYFTVVGVVRGEALLAAVASLVLGAALASAVRRPPQRLASVVCSVRRNRLPSDAS